MLTAVLAALTLTLLRPQDVRIAPAWILPLVDGLLLAALVARDPGRIDQRSAQLRVLSICMIGLLVLDALVATGYLVAVLIEGGSLTTDAGDLLAAGAVVWASNVIAFSLLYWDLDSGGAAARAHRMPPAPDLAFPQQLSPEIAPPDWRPQFVDYLYLGLTSSTAFSPTDVMPLAPWAKLAMGCQHLISLTVVGLVVARAVNALA
jgi:hypothetical protein